MNKEILTKNNQENVENSSSSTSQLIQECWGVLFLTKFANITAFKCECGMEMCIHCYTICHYKCGSYLREYNNFKLQGNPLNIENIKKFFFIKSQNPLTDKVYSCTCKDRNHFYSINTGGLCKLANTEIFKGDGSFLCSECNYKICQFCLKFCHSHSLKPSKEEALGNKDYTCNCHNENHDNPKNWAEELKGKPDAKNSEFVKESLGKFLINDDKQKKNYKFLKYLWSDLIDDIEFFESMIEKYYELRLESIENFNDYMNLYTKIFYYYTNDLKLVKGFHFSMASVKYRLNVKKHNLLKFSKHNHKFFYLKLNEIVIEVLTRFMKQRKATKSDHAKFLFNVIFLQILNNDLILKISTDIKNWKYIYKNNRRNEKPSKSEMEKCIFINNCVDKLFFIIQIFCRDHYLLSNNNEEINYNVEIDEFFNLMYFNINPLNKYRYFATLINNDPYYNQVREFNFRDLNEEKMNKDYVIIKEFTNLYNEMKKLGVSYDNEISCIDNYEGEILLKKELNNELKSAYDNLFCRLFNRTNINLSEIRNEMYKKENDRKDEFKAYFTKKIINNLSATSDSFWIQQMIFKIRHYTESFEEYLITFLSLYLYNEKTFLDLLYSQVIHKAIKGILSTSIISLIFVYELLVLFKASNKKFLNTAVFIYISFIINQLKFNNEDIEKIFYILKILCLINKYTNYSNAKVGRELIKKMINFINLPYQIRNEKVKLNIHNHEEKKIINKNMKKEISLEILDLNININDNKLNQKSDYLPFNKNETEEEIELINIKKSNYKNENELQKDNEETSIFFVYLEYLSDFAYYDTEIKEILFEFFEKNILKIEKILQTKNLKIRDYVILIRYLTNFFIADFINHDKLIADEKFLLENDIEICVKDMENDNEDDPFIQTLSRYQISYTKILKILINEVHKIKSSKYYLINDGEIVQELIISSRKITDLFILKSDDWINSLYWYIYKLTVELIEKGKDIFSILGISSIENDNIIKDCYIKVKNETFDWEFSLEINRILSQFYKIINSKKQIFIVNYDFDTYIKELSAINHPIDKTSYLKSLNKTYLIDDKMNSNENYNNYVSKDKVLKKWETFVEHLKYDNTKNIFSFFEYFADNFFFDDVSKIEKYKSYIKITHPQTCLEITKNKKKKTSRICFEIMNTMFFCNTKKMQNLLNDFKNKDQNKDVFSKFMKNLALILKENLFTFIESSIYETSERLAKHNQLLFNILDFLLNLKEEFCTKFVNFVMEEYLAPDNTKKTETFLIKIKYEKSLYPIHRNNSILLEEQLYSIYGVVCNSFMNICILLEKSIHLNIDFRSERLVVLFFVLSKFIIEYIEGSRKVGNEKNFIQIKKCLTNTLIFDLLFVKTLEEKEIKEFLIKSRLLNLLTSIVFEYNFKFDNEIYIYLNDYIKPKDIWDQVTHYIKLICDRLNIKNISLEDYLINLKLSYSSELTLAVKYYIFLKYWKGNKFVNRLKYQFDLTEEDIKIKDFLNQIVRTIECCNELKERKNISFLIPPKSFNLSKETKNIFQDKVDRSSRNSKVESLNKNYDLFLFEIYSNEYNLDNLKIYYQQLIETINYILILIEQILLMLSYMKYENGVAALFYVDYSGKFYIDDGVKIVSIIQLVYCSISLFVWLIIKFKLEFTRNYFIKNNKTISKLNKIPDNTREIFKEITNNLNSLNKSFFEQNPFNLFFLKILLIDTLFNNNQIVVIIFSIILNIIYLSTGYSVCLAIQVLFICNLVGFLYFIIIALEKKTKDLLSVLFFNYLSIYIFTWIAFYHLSELFTVPDALDSKVIII